MLWINWKVELKRRSMKNCVSASAGVQNNNADSDNINLLLQTQIYMFLSSLHRQKATTNY